MTRDANTSRCLVLENWRSPAELEAHFKLPYMKHVVSVLREALDGRLSPVALLRETPFVAQKLCHRAERTRTADAIISRRST